MSLASVITSFLTGSYTVTRRAAGTYDANGVYVPAAPSTFSIDASIQPLTGRQLMLLPEAFHGEESWAVYTLTELRTESASGDPDAIEIDGLRHVVRTVKKWQSHYECIVTKAVVP
jgi:hypothetical protein